MWDRLRCEQCGKEFSSENPEAFTCPRCDALHQAALKQTATMPAPALEDRPWSKSWNRERLGTNTDRDD
jgi:phage FluMu protein Com